MVSTEIGLYCCIVILHSIYRFCANSTTFNYVDNPFELNKPGIGLTLIYMFIEGIIFFIFTLFIQVHKTYTYDSIK